jgi:hypothetical protein
VPLLIPHASPRNGWGERYYRERRTDLADRAAKHFGLAIAPAGLPVRSGACYHGRMIALPNDVQKWLTYVFRHCNHEAASKLSLVPNAHEPWIDFAIIENLQRVSSPYKFKSDWLVSITTHWLGYAPMWDRWEIADIGFLVMMRSGGKVVRSKVALLQSKRIYAQEQKPETPEEIRKYYYRGFSRLYADDKDFIAMTRPRQFQFAIDCEYSALQKDSEQWKVVEKYEAKTEIPVYYLLYNPLQIPLSVSVPHGEKDVLPKENDVGCRIVPCRHLHGMMKGEKSGTSPSYHQLVQSLPAPFDPKVHRAGWQLEHFVVDLLFQCKTGRITDVANDEGLFQVFFNRTAPIQAAIAISIDAPDGTDWDVEPEAAPAPAPQRRQRRR